jgi:hypothetical protein
VAVAVGLTDGVDVALGVGVLVAVGEGVAVQVADGVLDGVGGASVVNAGGEGVSVTVIGGLGPAVSVGGGVVGRAGPRAGDPVGVGEGGGFSAPGVVDGAPGVAVMLGGPGSNVVLSRAVGVAAGVGELIGRCRRLEPIGSAAGTGVARPLSPGA